MNYGNKTKNQTVSSDYVKTGRKQSESRRNRRKMERENKKRFKKYFENIEKSDYEYYEEYGKSLVGLENELEEEYCGGIIKVELVGVEKMFFGSYLIGVKNGIISEVLPVCMNYNEKILDEYVQEQIDIVNKQYESEFGKKMELLK